MYIYNKNLVIIKYKIFILKKNNFMIKNKTINSNFS